LNIEVVFTITAIVFTLVEFLGIIAAFHAVMNARTSQGAIAWAISLVTLPVVALVLYAIFGRSKFKGYATLRHMEDEKIQYIMEQCRGEALAEKMVCEPASISELALTRLVELPITRFNKSELLIDGDTTFEAIFAGIESAQNYILIEFFIIKDDELGRELKTRLIRKAAENIRIYFLYDEIGSHKLPDSYIQEMREAGITTSAFHSTRGKTNQFQLNFRNHRKIVVVDGKSAYVGGHNVGDEYVSRHPKFGPWRDTHIKLEGPVVKTIQFCFIEDWYWATSDIPELSWDLQKAREGNEKTLMIASGPADAMDTCGLMFVQAINAATKRIWIASPYFVPDSQILAALKLAALRNVDVRILLPEKPDHKLVYLASFSYYQRILPPGIKLYRYTAGFMHQKVFLVDSSCAAVGTANLDNRSFRLNFELTLLNYDSGFIEDVENMLQTDFDRSRQVKLTDYTGRSFFFKLAVSCARIFSPIL
jgi:cardiolipin synthase A/B